MTSSTATKAESMAPLVFREFDAVFVHFDRIPVRVQRSKASMGRRYSMFHSCQTEKKYFLNPRVLPYSLLDISSSSSFESWWKLWEAFPLLCARDWNKMKVGKATWSFCNFSKLTWHSRQSGRGRNFRKGENVVL